MLPIVPCGTLRKIICHVCKKKIYLMELVSETVCSVQFRRQDSDHFKNDWSPIVSTKTLLFTDKSSSHTPKKKIHVASVSS